MTYLIALATTVYIGTLTTRLIIGTSLSSEIDIFLGTALGLGVVSQIIFYISLIGNHFNHFLFPFISIILLITLIGLSKIKGSRLSLSFKNKSLLLLFLIAIPLFIEANYFHMGGWDAWSCWNLKAKFIYLGQDHWKDMFDPVLWRSNTGYPLALPTINVWFWHWTGFSQNVPMFNAVLITLLTAGLLLLGLQNLKVPTLPSILLTVAVFTSASATIFYVSQYSDILFSLYLLCVFICCLLFHQTKNQGYLILSAIFIGLLSFTKNEGLAASAILTALILWQRLSKPWTFLVSVFLSALPTLLFMLLLAPKSQAFINGFISSQSPSTLERLEFILVYTAFEFISLKWMGLWVLALAGLAIGWKNAFIKPAVMIGFFVVLYLGIVLIYYQMNTFFTDIGWWMGFTLNRIILALMPSVFLWVGLSLFKTEDVKKGV